ncbi:MAG: cytochrome C oxidase subunit IV family protein [Elusimicrobia bacterium]|nr:cytochrome C oxidase subunit IV family protein [Elusimicrobiota bacterium]
MSEPLSTHSDDGINLAVYVALLALTAVTLGASLIHGGRLLTVSVAMIIAALKASLIGFYYMGLKNERLLTWVVLGIGALAVAVLLVGILPDMTIRRL